METPHIHVQNVEGQDMDPYTAAIELSNACREFYVNRVKTVQERKEKLLAPQEMQSKDSECHTNNDKKEGRKRTSIDDAMDTLRTEMASLIDQDLDLMKQLLTLNDQIEELKWRRRYSNKSPASSCNLDTSEYAMGGSETPTPSQSCTFLQKYPTPSSLSLCREEGTPASSRDLLFSNENADDVFPGETDRNRNLQSLSVKLTGVNRPTSYLNAQTDSVYVSSAPVGLAPSLNGGGTVEELAGKLGHSEQQSFDSGFNECDHNENSEHSSASKMIVTRTAKCISASPKITTL